METVSHLHLPLASSWSKARRPGQQSPQRSCSPCGSEWWPPDREPSPHNWEPVKENHIYITENQHSVRNYPSNMNGQRDSKDNQGNRTTAQIKTGKKKIIQKKLSSLELFRCVVRGTHYNSCMHIQKWWIKMFDSNEAKCHWSHEFCLSEDAEVQWSCLRSNSGGARRTEEIAYQNNFGRLLTQSYRVTVTSEARIKYTVEAN